MTSDPGAALIIRPVVKGESYVKPHYEALAPSKGAFVYPAFHEMLPRVKHFKMFAKLVLITSVVIYTLSLLGLSILAPPVGLTLLAIHVFSFGVDAQCRGDQSLVARFHTMVMDVKSSLKLQKAKAILEQLLPVMNCGEATEEQTQTWMEAFSQPGILPLSADQRMGVLNEVFPLDTMSRTYMLKYVHRQAEIAGNSIWQKLSTRL